MSSSVSGIGSSSGLGSTSDVTDAFLKFAKMSPAERIRFQYLKQHHLTEESLAALPPEKRNAIEKDIAEQIKQKLAKKEGGQNAGSGSDPVSRINILV